MKFFQGERRVINEDRLINKVKEAAFQLNDSSDLDPLMDEIGDAKFVLLGEASHGTHEYYLWRTRISKRLISEKNFSFITVEGDWPDCYRLNRYIKGYLDSGNTAKDVLHEFNRWPTWMWANWEIVALAEWLRKHNSTLPIYKRVGFYGLDVYSLWESMEAIVKYLKEKDPKTLRVAEEVVKCFEPYSDEGQAYARATYNMEASCQEEVINLLSEIRKKLPQYNTDHEAVFSAEQNALIAVNAERYYRAMINRDESSWNIRDRHMVDTLNRLMQFHGSKSKVIIWEHNTHIGDARATDMRKEGMVNVGQLVKEQRLKEGVVRVGFGSYKGSVIAGRDWGDEMKVMPVPEAPSRSWEYILHKAGANNKLLLSSDLKREETFMSPIGHRAIGVVYNPEYEKLGNYVPSIIPLRYEAFIYIDETMALHPLHIKPDGHQMPETFPWGE